MVLFVFVFIVIVFVVVLGYNLQLASGTFVPMLWQNILKKFVKIHVSLFKKLIWCECEEACVGGNMHSIGSKT